MNVEKAMKELIQIDEEQISVLIMPEKNCWLNAAKVLNKIGYPRVKNVIPKLLEWLKDANWPGAIEIAGLLLSIGKPVIPYVKDALKSDDATWKYWILKLLVEKWELEYLIEIKAELVELAFTFDLQEGVDIEVIKLLVARNVEKADRIRTIYRNKISVCKEYIENLESIMEGIESL